MIARLVAWSARHSWLVLALSLALLVAGGVAREHLVRDALPDLSPPQIVLTADWMGHPATEVAQRLTVVLARATEGTPGSVAVRGLSMSGMAYVDVVFAPGADLDAARRTVAERVARCAENLPPTARVKVGPTASSTGWVLEYALVDRHRRQSALALRRAQDELLAPVLASIPGVAEVASVGGGVQEVLVEVEAERLRARGAALSDVAAALRSRLKEGAAPTPEDLAGLALPAADSAAPPLHLSDVASVRLAEDMPLGIADLGGVQPAVGGVVVARRDADVPTVLAQVEHEIERLRPRLPAGVEIVTTYDRSRLVSEVGHTLARALSEEVVVVVAVSLLFLAHARSAGIGLVTLLAVLALTFAGMWLAGVPATVMSLGGIGIALGMAVDADIVALEACHRRLEALAPDATASDRRAALLAAAGAFAPAVLTSLVIAALAFLPVFAFADESARLLRPLAITKTLVIGAAALAAVTLAPGLRDRFLRGPVRPELESALMRTFVRVYRPFVHLALAYPAVTLAAAALALASAAPLAVRLGAEFLPPLEEGDLLFMPTTLPGAPADQVATELFRQDRALQRVPGVATVFGKAGRADTATDPAPFSMIETVVGLRPRAEWPQVGRVRWYSRWAPEPVRTWLGAVWPESEPETEDELVASLDRVARLPGWTSAWTSPIRARVDMMSTGVRTAVGARLVARDPARLERLGATVREVVARVPGARSVVFESLGGESRLDFDVDEIAAARFGVDARLVRETADLVASGGHVADLKIEGRLARVRLSPDVTMPGMTPRPEPLRGAADQLRQATVRSKAGAPVPLAVLGRTRFVREPSVLRTERGENVAYLYVDVPRDADLVGYVERARAALDAASRAGEVHLEPGERIEWTGEYELLAEGRRRLLWVVPLVAASMFLLLVAQFRSVKEALLVLASVPFALVGSVWALFLFGYSLSAPVWVGLLSVAGLAMQTGVVMVVYIDAAFYRRLRAGRLETREDIVAAHAEGTVLRLRPKVMTITAMTASLLPLLWADGAGAAILRRIAAPMFGGLVSSAFLTLEVLPVLYTIWRTRQLESARRSGRPLAEIVGPAPPWAREG